VVDLEGAPAATASTFRDVCLSLSSGFASPNACVDTTTVRGCDLIFMASHGRKGVAGLILGSETRKVLTHSKIPVLVSR
jgi:nucleotide-binding universal stress UspA family protein